MTNQINKPSDPVESAWDWRASLSAGRLALDQERFDRAKEWLTEARRRATAEDNRRAVAEIDNSLGVLMARTGDQAAAEKILLGAVSTNRELGDVSALAASMNNLAHVYSDMDRLEEAEALYREAISQIETLGPSSEVSASFANLGVVEARRGDFVGALEALDKAIEIDRTILGQYHPRLVTSLVNRAHVAVRVGRRAEALGGLREALVIAESVFDTGDPVTKQIVEQISAIEA